AAANAGEKALRRFLESEALKQEQGIMADKHSKPPETPNDNAKSKKILTALPRMAKAAQSEDLQAAFEKHEAETTDQVERLEQIFELIKHPAKGKTCDAINGMIDETQEVMKEFKGSAALDAGLLASAQTVEHYEISRYGTLKAWAEQLGLQ